MKWILNALPKWIFMFLWMGINVALFVTSFLKYYNAKEYFYLIKILGAALPVARASASVLNFNCMVILLPVCRNLISLLRGSSCTRCCKPIMRLMDHNLTFHKACAYMICINTAIHYYAHTFDFERFQSAHDDGGLLAALSNITTEDGKWLNPIRSPNTKSFPLQFPITPVVTTIAGVTGVVITLALIVIYSSATEVIRRSYFEVFWYTHHLFIIFYLGLIIHGAGGLVRFQVNTHVHDPETCEDKYKEWGTDIDCPQPRFDSGIPKTWMWILGPILLYIIERFIRFTKSFQRVVITKVVKHKSRVLELQMKKRDFKMQSGQYIFLQCPSISKLEWHPFTLTSAPSEDHFSVHIRTIGDWTTKLSKLCSNGNSVKNIDELPKLAVDGPFGTASEDVYQYEVDILIGAGIGVTPFASVLTDIRHKYTDSNFEPKLRRIYFYWLCPDKEAFDWFNELLKKLERQMAGTDLLNYNLYLTRGWDTKDAIEIAENDEEIYDLNTNLRSKTYYGRPNWDLEFQNIAKQNHGANIGVFFCGPAVLASQLSKMCNKHSDRANFVFNKENF